MEFWADVELPSRLVSKVDKGKPKYPKDRMEIKAPTKPKVKTNSKRPIRHTPEIGGDSSRPERCRSTISNPKWETQGTNEADPKHPEPFGSINKSELAISKGNSKLPRRLCPMTEGDRSIQVGPWGDGIKPSKAEQSKAKGERPKWARLRGKEKKPRRRKSMTGVMQSNFPRKGPRDINDPAHKSC